MSFSQYKYTKKGPCYVCGTGPSLQLLIPEYRECPIIGVNKIEDILTPQYLVVIDRLYPADNAVFRTKAELIFTKYYLNWEGEGIDPKRQIKFPAYNLIKWQDLNRIYLADHLPICCTATYTAIALAVYMGYQTIGVIGFDIYGHSLRAQIELIDKACGDMLNFAYGRGIEIVNLSPKSLINSLPRVEIEEFVKWVRDYEKTN